MFKTNFTRTPKNWWAAICLLIMALSYGDIVAQPLACNNSVNISIDDTPNVCQVVIDADMILEGNPTPGTDYGIEIKLNYIVIASGINEVTITDASQYFGATLTAVITDMTTGNSCWGSAFLEDKLAPVITCNDVTIECSEDPATAVPTAVDNCDLNPVVQLTGETTNTNTICSNGYATIMKTFVAVDDEGNVSNPCVQTVYIARPVAVDFPEDIIWQCDQYDDYNDIIDAEPLHPSVTDSDGSTPDIIEVSPNLSNSILNNTGSGIVSNIEGLYCNYQQSHSDQVLTTCGETFKIVRTWTVLDWCTNTVVSTGVGGEDNIQIIKVIDEVNPSIQRSGFTVSANIPGQHPQPCRSQAFLLPPTQFSDNCSELEIKIYTPVGEAIYVNGGGENGGLIPAPGLTIGVHNVEYQATDACGNQTIINVPVTVVDDIIPIAICDEITDVNLGTDGKAIVPATVFDDGSYDNCCMDKFLVRRMENNCGISGATTFAPNVTFCCEDIGNEVTVVFRALDCDNNHNDCMVIVEISDKIQPVLINCPANERRTCDWYADNLETQLDNATSEEEQCEILSDYFGEAEFIDNCDVNVDCAVNINIDQCLEGTIRRSFTAEDPSGNPATQNCIQTVFVDHVSDWVVEFPADISVECGTTVPDFGEPEIFYESCEMIAVSYEDVIYNTVVDACFKIVRDWSIINWCVVGDHIDQEVVEQPENELGLNFPACDLDGDGDCDDRTFRDSWNNASKPNVLNASQLLNPDTDDDSDPWDGYVIYQQVIKVSDSVDPVFTDNCQIPDVCIDGITCGATVILPEPAIDECSPEVNITAEILFGNSWASGFGPYVGVAPGTYEVRYVAEDNCNNQSDCTSTITINDCKKPTPYCKNGIIVELMVPVDPNEDAMVEVWASDLNEGSFDNCPGTLKYSFSADINDIGRTYSCSELGQNQVEVWVTDASGNQDFCVTSVIIQANMGQCGGSPLVSASGVIADEDNDPIENVSVSLNGQSTGSATSDATGAFSFNGITVGNDVTITPSKDDDHLNGVTTYDLVLISKHILGILTLDSPYKIIAADANNSGTVTTFDLVEARKLILMIHTSFTNNSSWRFIEKGYTFPDTMNPWSEIFPEVSNYNNITSSMLDADFVAVKIGDVNGSAVHNLTDTNEDRNGNESMIFEVNDQLLKVGEQVVIPFYTNDLNVLAYQFTLNYDPDMIQLDHIGEGIATEENFGFALLDQGALTSSWFAQEGESIDVHSPVFSLVFTAASNGYLSEQLQLNSRFTLAEAYQADGTALDIELQFNGLTQDEFELFQNTPNPFGSQTKIGFNLTEGDFATFTVTDFSGRVITKVAAEFTKGYNEIELNSSDFPASGVYYYTLETANETATRKMIVVE